MLYEALVAAGVEAQLVPLPWRCHTWRGRVENDEPERLWEAAPMALPFFVKHLRRWPPARPAAGWIRAQSRHAGTFLE